MGRTPDGLRRVATEVLAAAHATDPAEHTWHGFRIAMQMQGPRRVLVIGRRDRPPTVAEAQTIAAEFGAPDDTAAQAGKRKVRHPETGLLVLYHIVEFAWREA